MLVSSAAETRTGLVRLRPYQIQAIERVNQRIAAGVRRLVIVLATGGGKTTIAVQIILEAIGRGQRVLFLAHRRELISQAYARLIRMGLPDQDVGVLMGNDPRRRPAARVQVASVDTLRNRAKPHADIVFTDECHRSLARSYKDIAGHYPEAVHLGLTATPYRADGRGLGDAYDELVVVASPRQLMDGGHLVEPIVFTVPREQLPDLSSVRIRGGDYEGKQLDDAVNRKSLVGNLVDHWTKHACGKRTVAFAVSIEHSKHIAQRFREAGIAAEHLDGTTPAEQRDAILSRLAGGETLVVSNVGVLCEGTDIPALKCAILARPTKSMGLYLQQAGRILRPWNNESAIILDHAGCAMEHGLPQHEREFSLETKKKPRVKRIVAPPAKTCPSCYAVVPVACRTCPSCGEPFPTPERLPDEQTGVLVRVTPDGEAQRLRDEWVKLNEVAAQRGYRPGWAYYRFKEKFGRKPPKWTNAPARGRAKETREEAFARIQAAESNPAWAALRYRVEFGEAPPSP